MSRTKASQKQKPKSDVPPKFKSTDVVSRATFILAICLAFMLGIGVGSLLPQLMKDNQQVSQAKLQNSESAPQPQTTIPTKEVQQRLATLEQECLANPKKATAWVELGNAYFDADMYRDAIQAYKNACSLGADTADVLTDLGIMYRKIKDFKQAIEMFAKAQAKEPSHLQSRLNEAIVLYYDLGNKQDALNVLKDLMSIHPQTVLPDGRSLQQFIDEIQN